MPKRTSKARSKKQSPQAAAKQRLALKTIMADAQNQFVAIDAKEVEALLAEDPDFAETVADFRAALMLLKMPDDGPKH